MATISASLRKSTFLGELSDPINAPLTVVASAHPVIVSVNSLVDPPENKARPVAKGNVVSVAHLAIWARTALLASQAKMAKWDPWCVVVCPLLTLMRESSNCSFNFDAFN